MASGVNYDVERMNRLREEAWFNCAKCGREVRESAWISLCNDCGEEEEAAESVFGRNGDYDY